MDWIESCENCGNNNQLNVYNDISSILNKFYYISVNMNFTATIIAILPINALNLCLHSSIWQKIIKIVLTKTPPFNVGNNFI